MPVRFLITLLALSALVPLGLAFVNDDAGTALYAVPGAILFAVAFVFRPELEWAYYRRYPSDLGAPVVKLLETKLPGYYARLDETQRLALRQRTELTASGLDFKPQTQESTTLPADFAALLAIQLARLTVGLSPKHTIPQPFEIVVVYRHPFPSRQFPEHVHNSELFEGDGVVLLSLHQALPAAMDPGEYFNIALYEWVRACGIAWDVRAVPDLPDYPTALREVLGREAFWVRDAIGLPDEHIDDTAVLHVLRLDFPEAFAKTYPALAQRLNEALRPAE